MAKVDEEGEEDQNQGPLSTCLDGLTIVVTG